MPLSEDELEELTGAIISAAIQVHRSMGPGLLESVYKSCLTLELRARDLEVEVERRVPLVYRGQPIEPHLVVDLIVQDAVVVEVKAVSALVAVHSAQVLTYVRLTGCPAGLLMNFNTEVLRHGIRRLTHPDLYKCQHRADGLPPIPARVDTT